MLAECSDLHKAKMELVEMRNHTESGAYIYPAGERASSMLGYFQTVH